MSEYRVEGKEKGEIFCLLGFNRQLNTFYAQVINRTCEQMALGASLRIERALGDKSDVRPDDVRLAALNSEMLFVGALRNEITSVEELAEKIQRFVELNPEIKAQLQEEQLCQRETYPVAPSLLERCPVPPASASE